MCTYSDMKNNAIIIKMCKLRHAILGFIQNGKLTSVRM